MSDVQAAATTSGGRLAGRFVGLGVTGSIAAYKAVELLRLLRAEGADVQVLLSQGAPRFVAPLALETLSGRPVDGDVLALLPDGRIGHILVADSADAVVVAPASASWLGAMANGLAGDTITATCLATSAPVVVAPAMDGDMYAHPATQANVARLRDAFGYRIVEPEVGPLASGQFGPGRLANLPKIVDAVVDALAGRPIRSPDPASRPPAAPAPRETDLLGRRLVVTAGGTAEPIDPVRFIGNRSSGKMGVAIAEAALERGAAVTLVVGLTSVPLPAGARVVQAESTEAMRTALLEALDGPDGPGFDVLVMAAAVADFRPHRIAPTKLARGDALTLELEPTPDILAEIGRQVRGVDASGARIAQPREPRPILVGFAAETGSLERAAAKLAAKGVDLLVANDVAEPGSGFATDTNRVTILAPDAAPDPWPLLTKREVADRLLDRLVLALADREQGGSPTTMTAQEMHR